MKHLQGVLFDWAGTTVDYGCFSPVNVFVEVFRMRGVEITMKEAREPMGLLKIDHIRAICEMDRVAEAWEDVHGSRPNEQDVVEMYEEFEPLLFSTLKDYTEPLPHVVEAVQSLREAGLKIGSTTGFTREMIEVVAEEAKKHGYMPDAIVTSTDVPAGRPYPWMAFTNAMELNIYPMSSMVKVGDTVSDMKEGVHAGMWTVGVVLGSSTLGLSKDDVARLDETTLEAHIQEARRRLVEAGADYVIRDMSELMGILHEIDERYETDVLHA
ncbi:phosphonoacetaldehyde hydrolase [Pontibacillus halophilus JSM 076056 = DSM 19796]|uniref:Phosphonoacetaldehyde hydrolase n=1 Tax=Pontibacillus halophilus JSM 076056 = DSM 19796 TaxID=1385510 RepID=A0A0A5GS26_9BACI|nr:phosphonoacetaldehyde hydrolase [Pontibacillus halophilus]KGX94018.1 phosphonoacetaldehyde hydrolase [Pontibacillus halophilus JSM 076056 = DSM 19796]